MDKVVRYGGLSSVYGPSRVFNLLSDHLELMQSCSSRQPAPSGEQPSGAARCGPDGRPDHQRMLPANDREFRHFRHFADWRLGFGAHGNTSRPWLTIHLAQATGSRSAIPK